MEDENRYSKRDFSRERLDDSDTLDDLMKNEFFRVIHMAALANVGAMTATFLAIYIIWQWLGLINPADLLKSIL